MSHIENNSNFNSPLKTIKINTFYSYISRFIIIMNTPLVDIQLLCYKKCSILSKSVFI